MTSSVSHSAMADNVKVQSTVSSETQSTVSQSNSQKMTELMSRLGTTHSQIDEYSKRRTDQISDAVNQAIQKVVVETQSKQQDLLQDANVRSAQFEQEYKMKLQEFLQGLDASKAANLAALEKDLNMRQEMILDDARKRIDDINNEANRLKMGVLQEAQAAANAKIGGITDQIAAAGAADAARRMESTTTTVITSTAAAQGASHMEATASSGHGSSSHSSSSSSTRH